MKLVAILLSTIGLVLLTFGWILILFLPFVALLTPFLLYMFRVGDLKTSKFLDLKRNKLEEFNLKFKNQLIEKLKKNYGVMCACLYIDEKGDEKIGIFGKSSDQYWSELIPFNNLSSISEVENILKLQCHHKCQDKSQCINWKYCPSQKSKSNDVLISERMYTKA